MTDVPERDVGAVDRREDPVEIGLDGGGIGGRGLGLFGLLVRWGLGLRAGGGGGVRLGRGLGAARIGGRLVGRVLRPGRQGEGGHQGGEGGGAEHGNLKHVCVRAPYPRR